MLSSWNRPRLFFCEGFCEEQVIIEYTCYSTPVSGTCGQDVIIWAADSRLSPENLPLIYASLSANSSVLCQTKNNLITKTNGTFGVKCDLEKKI